MALFLLAFGWILAGLIVALIFGPIVDVGEGRR